jgi:5'-phosphate synthase pdxT subunit
VRTVGVLALQGGFAAHAQAVADLGARAVLVRAPLDLVPADALVLPGGESTAQLRLIERAALAGPLRDFAASGRPVFATCAGLILAAAHVTHPDQTSFGWIDVTVARNAWGRQIASFEAVSDDGALPLVFIRAPRIVGVGAGVEVLARFRGEPILVRQGSVTGATFHPELTSDRRVHAAALTASVLAG